MAIEKAGSFKSAKVRDAIFGGEFKGTMMGDVKYNAAGPLLQASPCPPVVERREDACVSRDA